MGKRQERRERGREERRKMREGGRGRREGRREKRERGGVREGESVEKMRVKGEIGTTKEISVYIFRSSQVTTIK